MALSAENEIFVIPGRTIISCMPEALTILHPLLVESMLEMHSRVPSGDRSARLMSAVVFQGHDLVTACASGSKRLKPCCVGTMNPAECIVSIGGIFR